MVQRHQRGFTLTERRLIWRIFILLLIKMYIVIVCTCTCTYTIARNIRLYYAWASGSGGLFPLYILHQEDKMQKYETIDVTQAGEIVTIALNRPKFNLFNERMMRELTHAFSSQRENTTARFIILTARGEHFSGGIDLKEINDKGFGTFKPLFKVFFCNLF